ncbi:MAG: DUF5610 domain-containing protein [Neptuniibacter sp.]
MESYKRAQHSTLIGKRNQKQAVTTDSSVVISREINRSNYKKRFRSQQPGIGRNNLELLFQAFIFHFNHVFEDDLGKTSLDSFLEPGQELSIHSISDKVVTLTTDIFRTYFELHPELTEQKALDQFMNMACASIEMAFADIKEILDNFHLLDDEATSFLDDVAENIAERNSEFINSFGYSCDEYFGSSMPDDSEKPSHYLWSKELISH